MPDATHACRETANWDAACADARKTPPQGEGGRTHGAAFRAGAASGGGSNPLTNRSPVEHVHPGKLYPPFLIFHVGLREDSHEQAELLAGKLRQAGGRAVTSHERAKNHITINRELGEPGDEPTRKVFEFLEGELAGD